MFVVEWDDTGLQDNLPRLRLLFQAESPRKFAERIAAALENRRQAEIRILYNLYVDCMPTDDVPVPPDEQIQRVSSLAQQAGKLRGVTPLGAKILISEIRLDYARTLNKIVLDKHRSKEAIPELPVEAQVSTKRVRRVGNGTVSMVDTTDTNTDTYADDDASEGFEHRLQQFMFSTLSTLL